MAKKSASSQVYEVTPFAPGIVTLEGTILEVTESHVVINSRRPRTSRMDNHVIPRAKILVASADVGQAGVVVFKSEKVEDKPISGTLDKDANPGYLTISTESGSFVVNPDNATIFGEVVAAPEKTEKKSKQVADKKKVKVKKSK